MEELKAVPATFSSTQIGLIAQSLLARYCETEELRAYRIQTARMSFVRSLNSDLPLSFSADVCTKPERDVITTLWRYKYEHESA